MNDPNGMFFYEGEYHLFYQHYPDSNVWGPMHWGHGVSRDMLRWEHLPIALYPDSLGYIFSGSAVVDWNNTSGFSPDSIPPLVAIFSYHDPVGEKAGKTGYQSQGIAYSLDKGRSWTKYKGNPVLSSPEVKDFRDPKVRWYAPGQFWVMALAVLDHISFYSSKDLKSWAFESDFGLGWGSHIGVWECPDLFDLPAGDSGERLWVLLVSVNKGGISGGSATQYFIGNFDGSRFELLEEGFGEHLASTSQDQSLTDSEGRDPASQTADKKVAAWLDLGPDNYAGVTWSDIPDSDGRTLFMGWMSNWIYAQVVPTQVWRSAMTLPRELSLERDADGIYRLKSAPVREVDSILADHQAFPQGEATPPFLVSLEVEGDFSLVLSNDANESVEIVLSGNLLSFDRRKSGITDFHSEFARNHQVDVGNLKCRTVKVFVDTASLEIFLNDGQVVMTEIVFPKKPYQTMETSGSVVASSYQAIDPVMRGSTPGMTSL